MQPEHQPAVAAVDVGLIVQGAALFDLSRLVRLGLRACRQDGIGAPVSLLQLQRAVDGACERHLAMAHTGHADVPEEADLQTSSVSLVHELMSTKEAAEALGLSTRQVRRLSDELGGRKRGQVLLYDRAAVEARVARQAQEEVAA